MLPASTIVDVAQNGSPFVLSAVGRLFGLGADEQLALARGQISRWAVLGIGLSLGVVAGVYAHKRWPQTAGKIVGS